MALVTEEEQLLKTNKHFNIAWLAASRSQLTGVIDIKKRIGRDTIQAYNTSKLCQLILENETSFKLKTKAQLLYGASKIMRQQSYFLYDDSTKLWSKLKSDMLNPTVSSFIDMEKTTVPSGAITLSDVESMLQFQTSSEGPSFSSLFDYNFSYSNDMDNDANNSSFIMRIENSRDISNLMTDNTFDMAKDSIHPDQPFDSLIKQQHIFDHIYMSDMGRMEDYDMFDYGFDIQQQQEVSAVLNAPLARQNQAQSNAFDFPLDTADMHLDHQKQQSDARARYISPLNQASPRLGAPDLITTADYYSLGPIHNRSGPPSLIQEEDEEQDNMSISSISTGNLSTIFPIRVVNDSVTPRTDVNTTRRVRRMVASTTMLSYAEDYSTDRLLRGLTPSIQKSQRQQKLTEKQRMAIIRKCLRYPSTVLDTFSYNTNLLTEQGAGGQQHQVLAFFNRNRLADDQIEKSRRYEHLRRRNTSGSLSSHFTANGIRRLSHQISSGGVSIRSNSDVHSTPELHKLVFDGDVEPNQAQEDTVRWQKQQFEVMNNDDTVDYGGDDIDFNTDVNVGFDDHLLHPQEDNMQEFMEHIKQLPNPFVFNEFFQMAEEEASIIAKSFSNILELASKSQIRVSQSDPYGLIQVSMKCIP